MAFVLFFVVHVVMVIAHGFGVGMERIVLGSEGHSQSLAVLLGACGIVFVIVLNIVATRSSLRWPTVIKRLLELGIDPLKRLMFHHWTSKQDHRPVSPYARVNGRPPKNAFSGAIRPSVPATSGQRFRRHPGSDSGDIRAAIPEHPGSDSGASGQREHVSRAA